MAKFSDVDFTNPDNTFRVSFSGGKDSAAMVIMLLEKGYPVTSIDFMDSKNEYPELYEYIDRVDKYLSEKYNMHINIIPIKEEWEFEKWFYSGYTSGKHKGEMRGFPKVLSRMCYLTRQKGRMLDRYDTTSYRYIGIGSNESRRVSDNPRLLYPLVEWNVTEDQCVEYLKEIDLMPTHKKYYTRSGCWWCPKQSVQSSFSLYIRHPDLWQRLKTLESESPHGWNLPGRTTDDLELKLKKYVTSGKVDLKKFLDDKTEDEYESTYQRIMNK